VIHDKYGNAVSMLHTLNDLPFGTGLFVQGVALPGSTGIWHNIFFLQGPWNDRSKSVQLPDGQQNIIVAGSDGLPQTLVTAIHQLHLITTPLVLLTSGWGRSDLVELVRGPFAWPAPDPGFPMGYNPLQFMLFTKDDDWEASCKDFCPVTSPFLSDVVADLEPWILPYTQVVNATNITGTELASLGTEVLRGILAPAILRIQNRSIEDGATEIAGVTTFWYNGVADPVPTEN